MTETFTLRQRAIQVLTMTALTLMAAAQKLAEKERGSTP